MTVGGFYSYLGDVFLAISCGFVTINCNFDYSNCGLFRLAAYFIRGFLDNLHTLSYTFGVTSDFFGSDFLHNRAFTYFYNYDVFRVTWCILDTGFRAKEGLVSNFIRGASALMTYFCTIRRLFPTLNCNLLNFNYYSFGLIHYAVMRIVDFLCHISNLFCNAGYVFISFCGLGIYVICNVGWFLWIFLCD